MLTRDGDGPYQLVSSGTASPAVLVDYGIDRYERPEEFGRAVLPFLERYA